MGVHVERSDPPGRVPRGMLSVVWYDSTRFRRFVVAASVVALLSACDFGLATRGGLVFNRTEQDLVVEVVGAADTHRREVAALRGVQWDAYEGCLGTGIALFTPEGEQLTTLDRRICDGEQLTIRPDDLPSERP